MGPRKTKKLLHCKAHYHLAKAAAYRMGFEGSDGLLQMLPAPYQVTGLPNSAAPCAQI